jgi:ABC-type multidrug transport system fused ATPase/permease subunit
MERSDVVCQPSRGPQGLILVVVGLVLAVCSGAGAAQEQAGDGEPDPGRLVVDGYGAEYEEIWKKVIGEPFGAETGIEIEYIGEGSATEAYTAIRAAAPRTATGDVVLRDVVKRYGSELAVDHLSLEVRAGELLTLLGPSGCGKTTTLSMIAGFIEPDAGSIMLGGQDVSHLPPNRRNSAMVFQQYALFPHMTVAENVAFGLRMRKIAATSATAASPRAWRSSDWPGSASAIPAGSRSWSMSAASAR